MSAIVTNGEILLPEAKAEFLMAGVRSALGRGQTWCERLPSFGPKENALVTLSKEALDYLTRISLSDGKFINLGSSEYSIIKMRDIRDMIDFLDNKGCDFDANSAELTTILYTRKRGQKLTNLIQEWARDNSIACQSCGRYDATERPCGAVLCDADGCITPHEAHCFDCDEQHVPESDRD